MRRLLVWLGLVALVAYLVFVGGAWSGLYSGWLRLTSEVLAGAVLGTWAIVARSRPEWRPRSMLLPVIATCLASLAISTVFSVNPRVSIDYLIYGGVLAALYLLLVRLMAEPFFRLRFASLATLLFIAIAIAFGALVLNDWARWLSVVGHFDIPPLRPAYESLVFGSPQGVLVIVALLAVPIAASVDWGTRRGIFAIGATLVTVGLVGLVSGSRGAWLALAVAGVFAFILIAVMGRTAVRSWLQGTVATGRRRALVAAAVIVVGAATMAVGPRILDRVTAGGEANRIGFVADSVRLFAEHPLTGSGPGTWVIERPRLTQAGEVDDYQPHAHDVYAQTLGELGIFGIAAGVILVVSLSWLLLGAIRGSDPSRRRWAIATAVGAVYFLAHQLVDFWADMPALLFAVAVPVAYLDATAVRPMALRGRTVPTRIGGRTLVVSGFALAVGLSWLGYHDVRAIRYESLVALADAGDWTGVAPELREIAGADAEISAYVFTAGLAADRAGNHSEALADFQKVVSTDDLPEAWLDLAAEQFVQGDTADSHASLVNAFRLGVQRPGVAVAIGDLALRDGDQSLARESFSAALANAPSLAADPWWSQDPARRAAFEEAVTDAVGQGGWEVALMAGDATGAENVATSIGVSPETVLFIHAWAGDTSAANAIFTACRAQPSQVAFQLWCARLEHRDGNESAANEFTIVANAQGREAFLGALELRVVTGQPSGIQQGGGLATAWGIYTYRRPTPADILVPSLVHLEYR